MQKLPPLSKNIRVLTADESERLDAIFPSIPKSLKDCITCAGDKTFRWWADPVVRDEDKTPVDYECPCADQFVLHKFLLNAGIGTRYQRSTVGDIETIDGAAATAVADYIENSVHYAKQGRGFIFRGRPGTGKTLLAALLLKQILDKGVEGYFTTFTDMLDNYAAGWRDDKNRAWFNNRVRNVPLLVVDDVGKENAGLARMSSTAIDNVFRTRVQSAQPTIMTTNFSVQELAERYGSAMELMREASFMYEFDGESFRARSIERSDNEARLKLTRPIVID